MKDQEFYHIIEKQLTGEITSEERSRLTAWLAHSTENRKVYERMELYWKLTGSMKADITIDTDKALESLNERIDGKKTKVIPLQTYRLWAAAAAIILLAVASIIFFNVQSKSKYIVFESGDQIKKIELSDGSVVTLNEFSSLWYQEDLHTREVRNLRLEGEAFFEVARDEERPFKVDLENTMVEVLGTSFNISAYEDQEIMEVAVNSGKVGFYKSGDPGNMLTLEAGDQAIYNKSRNIIIKSESLDLNYLSWKEKELVFRDNTLEEVFETLEEYFNTQFILDNPTIANCTFTGSFSNPRLDEVLEVIGLSLNLNFNSNQNQTQVAGEGCTPD